MSKLKTGHFKFQLVNENIVDVLRLNFGDVSKEESDAMTVQDAQKIKLFVEGVWDYASQIIVHCMGGVSRSAGVCAGILKSKYNNDEQIFNNPRYCPNMHCYRLVVEEFLGRFSETEANEKYEHQLELWKERFFGDDNDD